MLVVFGVVYQALENLTLYSRAMLLMWLVFI